MTASDVLSAPPSSLPGSSDRLPETRFWADIFPATPWPGQRIVVVLVWAPWSAHVPTALEDLERVREHFGPRAPEVGILVASDPASREEDVAPMLAKYGGGVTRIPIQVGRFALTEAVNQNPTTLLFRDGQLIDRRLGAQTFEELRAWILTLLQLDKPRLM